MNNLIITIDGPAGSGKSTIAKLVSEKLNFAFLDTGAMYRAVTLTAVKAGFDLSDTEVMLAVMTNNRFEFKIENNKFRTKVNSADISDAIRTPEITDQVHYIAANPVLREQLVQMQRTFAYEQGSVVTEGRDQGTVAFPSADFKFFLTACPEERARRRQAQLKEAGIETDFDAILASIKERDSKDQNRAVSPLKPAADAIIIDTTNMTIDEVVEEITCQIKSKNAN